jgi:hypothetical protein
MSCKNVTEGPVALEFNGPDYVIESTTSSTCYFWPGHRCVENSTNTHTYVGGTFILVEGRDSDSDGDEFSESANGMCLSKDMKVTGDASFKCYTGNCDK